MIEDGASQFTAARRHIVSQQLTHWPISVKINHPDLNPVPSPSNKGRNFNVGSMQQSFQLQQNSHVLGICWVLCPALCFLHRSAMDAALLFSASWSVLHITLLFASWLRSIASAYAGAILFLPSGGLTSHHRHAGISCVTVCWPLVLSRFLCVFP